MVKKTNKDIFGMIKKYPKSNPKKCIIVAVFLLLALIGLILSKGVKINYNLSDYLGKDTQTSIALEIMTEEFGMTGNVQVMLTNIDKDTAVAVKEELSKIDGALNVSFDPDSDTSYKVDSSSALFTILIDGEDHSDTAKSVIEEIKTRLGTKYGAVELGGSTIEYNALRENTGNEMGLIIVLSIAMAAVLLLITASSWLEPLILLACSGIAIAINMGLNIFIGEISYITNSVSSILQLALSVDYSIVVIHSYREEKQRLTDNTEAMRRAVKAVLNPVSASALTTIAGLVALLFMSFTIGFDIGIVLIKGIVVSAVTALIFLPVVVLMLDDLIKKTAKRPFVPGGKIFSGFAFKASKIVAPLVAVFVIAGAILQSYNSYGFTDSIGSNKNIEKIFGRNDSIVLVYKTGNSEEDYKKEILLKKKLLEYKNSEGINPLTGYIASATTFKELYDLEKATKVLGLGEDDVKMLFAMCNIYASENALELTPYEFVRYAHALLNSNDPDIAGMADKSVKESIALLNSIADVATEKYTAAELIKKLKNAKPDTVISDFAINQMYGLYFYDQLSEDQQRITPEQLYEYIRKNSSKLPEDSQTDTLALTMFIKNSFVKNMPLNFEEYYQQARGLNLDASVKDKITPELIQQLYIMYIVGNNAEINGLPIIENKINGGEFIGFIVDTAKTNTSVSNSVPSGLIDSLDAACKALSEIKPVGFRTMTEKMNSLQSGTSIDSEKISGVYIKYAISEGASAAIKPVMACDLVDFISENMETNSLLKGKMNEERRAKVEDAQAVIAGAEDLFIAENYSRILLGARLPAEGPEMVAFIDYLISSMHEVFGNSAHITGKVVSTYDLQAAFDVDNLIITVFTIISIFLVILFIFKSLSLPIILVLVIQGSVWISLSLCLIGGGLVFFMSYIVTTCILMGATVDYGILMSNNYLVFRKTEDRTTALAKAVDSAMPTVFTSGLILVVCGFVISLISSQNSIASVGSLLAQGTLVSIIMITLGLPSLLYMLDDIILKLTLNDDQNLITRTKAGRAAVDFIKKILAVIFAPLNRAIEERRKKKEKADKLKRAKEKRAQTIASKKAARAAEEVAKEAAPRMTARMISKAIDEQRKQEKLNNSDDTTPEATQLDE